MGPKYESRKDLEALAALRDDLLRCCEENFQHFDARWDLVEPKFESVERSLDEEMGMPLGNKRQAIDYCLGRLGEVENYLYGN